MALLSVQNLEMRFGEKLIQRDVSFEVQAGSIFAVMELLLSLIFFASVVSYARLTRASA